MASNLTNITGIERGRAKFAYDRAKDARDKCLPKYDSYVKKIPMMIKINGLGAAFAFMYSKKNKPEGKTYMPIGEDVTAWLKASGKGNLYGIEKVEKFEDLVVKIVELDSSRYRALTIEVLAFFNWLRRFAEGLIEDKEDKKDDKTGGEAKNG